MIKTNSKIFKIIAATNNYIKTLIFRKDHLLIWIKTIKYCKMKFATKSIAYAKFMTNFLEDGS